MVTTYTLPRQKLRLIHILDSPLGEETLLFEVVCDLLSHLLRRGENAIFLCDFHFNLRVLRLLVRIVNTGETLDLARASSLVETLRIAVFAHAERNFHVHLDEPVTNAFTNALTILHVRRDERNESNHTAV